MTHHLFHGVDHGTGPEEEHCLEKGMGDKVKNAGHRGSTPHRQHHVTQLGHRAVCQSLLEVHLGESDRRTQEAGDRADDSNHGLNNRKLGIEWIQPGHQEHSCSNHRCGVDECGYRSRPFHGVRQPDMQRELG